MTQVSDNRYHELLKHFGGRMQLTECAICSNSFNAMREHCPACGARRIFIGSHSYEPLKTIIKARDGENLGREIVRAISSTFCSDERAQLQSPVDFE